MRERRVRFANEVVDSNYPVPLQFSRVLFCAIPLSYLESSWLSSDSDCNAEIRDVIAAFDSPGDDSELVNDSGLNLVSRPVFMMKRNRRE